MIIISWFSPPTPEGNIRVIRNNHLKETHFLCVTTSGSTLYYKNIDQFSFEDNINYRQLQCTGSGTNLRTVSEKNKYHCTVDRNVWN